MRESNKFTPGPWAVINRTGVFSELGAESGDGAKADPTDGWTIADCSAGCTLLNGDYVELGFAVQQANAKLIAAAPDLLEALENLLWHAEVLEEFIESERGRGRNADQLYADGEMHNYMVEAKASISKARGKQ